MSEVLVWLIVSLSLLVVVLLVLVARFAGLLSREEAEAPVSRQTSED